MQTIIKKAIIMKCWPRFWDARRGRALKNAGEILCAALRAAPFLNRRMGGFH